MIYAFEDLTHFRQCPAPPPFLTTIKLTTILAPLPWQNPWVPPWPPLNSFFSVLRLSLSCPFRPVSRPTSYFCPVLFLPSHPPSSSKTAKTSGMSAALLFPTEIRKNSKVPPLRVKHGTSLCKPTAVPCLRCSQTILYAGCFSFSSPLRTSPLTSWSCPCTTTLSLRL